MTVNSSKNGRRGAAIVEFAIVALMFFILLFGILEFGRVLMVRQLLENATREGARYAVVHTYDKTSTDVISHVQKYLVGQNVQLLKPPTIQCFMADPGTGKSIGAWTNAAFGQCIAVEITGQMRLNIPFVVQTIPLEARTIMCSEAN